jgi:sodium transport system permease protein
MRSARLIVARKEIVDHLRDRRSLASSLAYALMGPAVVLLVSFSPKARTESMPAVMIGMMSVFALVSAFTGGMNVATDVMSGERERRSLLPLLMTPTRPRDAVLGKWIAASVFALAAVAVSVAGLAVVLALRAPATLAAHSATLAAWAILGLAPLALLAAALEILVAGLSRTMKEAGTSLMLVMFLPMFIGMFLVFFPVGGRLWTVVPIVGQQILIDSGMRASGVPLPLAIVLALVTATSAWVPLAAAARVLGRDDVAA